MAVSDFLGVTCSCLHCCFLLGVTVILIGVAVMSLLLRAPFPPSDPSVKFINFFFYFFASTCSLLLTFTLSITAADAFVILLLLHADFPLVSSVSISMFALSGT